MTASPSHNDAPWTIMRVLKWTTERFTERRISSPRLDAELLVAHALNIERVRLYADFDRPLIPEELTKIRELIKRRQQHEPVAYITNEKAFWDCTFHVDPRVLIPRPDTETLIEAARGWVQSRVQSPQRHQQPSTNPPSGAPANGRLKVLDVGTGSGAIPVVLKRLFPQVDVFASDISADALAVAQLNASRLLEDPIELRQGNLLAPWSDHRIGDNRQQAPGFDVITANLPYIPSGISQVWLWMSTMNPKGPWTADKTGSTWYGR